MRSPRSRAITSKVRTTRTVAYSERQFSILPLLAFFLTDQAHIRELAFTVTLDRPDLSRRLVIVRYPQKQPTVLSVEVVGRLLEMAPGPKHWAARGTAYGAGLRVSEVATLKVGDIDSKRMLIRVERSGARKHRNDMLSPQLLESDAASCCSGAGCFPAEP